MISNFLSRLAHVSLSVFLVITAVPAPAQLQPPYERVLVPIFIATPVPGAFGSLWATELIARNEAASLVEVTVGLPQCVLQPPCGYASMTTFRPEGLFRPNPNGGVFVFVGAPGAAKVIFSLRVRDLSRQALTWGTAIPVIREAQTYTSRLELLDVPTDARFRVALRVYDFDAPNSRSVRLRIYDVSQDNRISGLPPQTALVDVVLRLETPVEDVYSSIPGSAVMTDLIGAFPQLSSARIVRIVLDPVSTDLRFWAFASVTNDETQHVTAIAPNK